MYLVCLNYAWLYGFKFILKSTSFETGAGFDFISGPKTVIIKKVPLDKNSQFLSLVLKRNLNC